MVALSRLLLWSGSPLDLQQLLNVFDVFSSSDFDKEPPSIVQLRRLGQDCSHILPQF